MLANDLHIKLQSEEFHFGDLLQNTWDVYSSRFGHYLPIILFLAIPLGSLSIFFEDDIVALIITATLGTIPGIMFITTTHQIAYEGHTRANTDASVAHATRLIIPCLIVNVLSALAMMLGFLLLIIPGIIVANYLAFVLDAVVLRGQRGLAALEYSYELIKDRWWRTFGTMFGIAVVVAIPLGVVTWLGELYSPYLNIALTPFFSTFTTIASTLLFLNYDPSPPLSDPETGKKSDEIVLDVFDWNSVSG